MSELGRPFLPPDLRRLIEIDRNAADPPAEVKRGVAARLDRNLGLGGALLIPGPALGLDSSNSVPPPPPLPRGLLGWKVVAGAAVAVVVGGVAALSMMHRTQHLASISGGAPAAVVTAALRFGTPVGPAFGSSVTASPTSADETNAASKDAVAAAASASSRSVRAAGEASAQRAAQRRHLRAHTERSLDTLAAERSVLDTAHAALVRHDGAAALVAVRDHEQRFSHGQLLEERESMRVQAFALLGDSGSVRSAGERFRRHFPRSMFLPVVEQALDSVP